MWVHTRNGTHTEAKVYAQKEISRISGPWTYGSEEGIPETQGTRSDLAAVKRKLDEHVKLSQIAEEHFSDFVRYNRGFKEYKRLKANKRHWEMEVITLFGDTATGKTRWAYQTYGEDLYSVPPPKSSGTYWDDYDGQETVLIDEMYGKRFTHGFLLQLLDRYPLCVPVHGSSVNFSSRRIILTSNQHPSLWYNAMYEAHNLVYYHGPLHRRLVQGDSCIIHCSKDREGYYKEFRLDDDYKIDLLL